MSRVRCDTDQVVRQVRAIVTTQAMDEAVAGSSAQCAYEKLKSDLQERAGAENRIRRLGKFEDHCADQQLSNSERLQLAIRLSNTPVSVLDMEDLADLSSNLPLEVSAPSSPPRQPRQPTHVAPPDLPDGSGLAGSKSARPGHTPSSSSLSSKAAQAFRGCEGDGPGQYGYSQQVKDSAPESKYHLQELKRKLREGDADLQKLYATLLLHRCECIFCSAAFTCSIEYGCFGLKPICNTPRSQ